MAAVEATLVAESPPASKAPVLEPLTENECYLVAILTDLSGLDLAEFLWYDGRSEDGCWRAWPFQWPWWRDRSAQQVDQAARSVGKSESILARACAFVVNFMGQELLITAPEGIHLDAITDRLEAKFQEIRFFRELLVPGRGGINHRPFKATFTGGTLVRGRIPQITGIGVKGQHPVRLEMDEAQDYPKQGWIELVPTVNWKAPNAEWRIHGVTKGIQDDFFEYTQDGSGFRVHRIPAQMVPGWRCSGCAENGPDCRVSHERERLITRYGDPNNPDYRRNVLGEHGDATNAVVRLEKLMRCVDVVEGSTYNVDEYHEKRLTIEQVEDRVKRRGESIYDMDELVATAMELLDLPALHTNRDAKKVTWGGADVGVTKDPTEILLALEYKPDPQERRRHDKVGMGVPAPGSTRVKLQLRVQLKRFDLPLQARLIMELIDYYRPRAFSIDKTGNGVGLLQSLQRLAGVELVEVAEKLGLSTEDLDRIRAAAETADEDLGEIDEETRQKARRAISTIKGYGFGEKVLVRIDPDRAAELGPNAAREKVLAEAGVYNWVLDQSTDQIREIIDEARWLMPLRKDLIEQFTGQTWTYGANRRRLYSKGEFHVLDAMRMLMLGMTQQAIEIVVSAPERPSRPVRARFGLR